MLPVSLYILPLENMHTFMHFNAFKYYKNDKDNINAWTEQ